jgi:GTP cyclohydrolase II
MEGIGMGSGVAGMRAFGDKAQIEVDRGLAEFRSGRPVLLRGGGETLLTLPVEGLDAPRLAAFTELCAPTLPRLAISARRARALGLAAEPAALKLAPGVSAARIFSLAADAQVSGTIDAEPLGPVGAAAIELAKLAQGLPAALAAPGSDTTAVDPAIAQVEAQAVGDFRRGAIRSLKIAAQADVPLHGGFAVRFVVFSDTVGGSSAAIIIGKPDVSGPVPVRLHSACLTGDVFSSRRCDCGDQLRLSLARLQEAGGGIVLYLAQEGRGLGLANKMRAYQLQDAGLDTVDANTTLGFEDDERTYDVAARMLELLGCRRVFLLTNNPAKVEGLAACGIEIRGRMALVTPINSDNLRYLTAKAARAGHRLHHLAEAFAPDSGLDGAPRGAKLTRSD